MKTLYLIISLILLTGSITFISCTDCLSVNGGSDCSVIIYCEKNDDCKDSPLDDVACVAGECHSNPCTDAFCGTGTCVLEDDPSTTDFEERAYCKCDEDSLPYNFSGRMICSSKCENHNDCSGGIKHCINGQCNERNICVTDDECPESNICDDEQCKNKPIEE